MRQSDFRIVADLQDILAIEDLDAGNLSVTNDAEGVIARLAASGGLGERRLIYRDTDGVWDELQHDAKGRFAGFGAIRARTLGDALQWVRAQPKGRA